MKGLVFADDCNKGNYSFLANMIMDEKITDILYRGEDYELC